MKTLHLHRDAAPAPPAPPAPSAPSARREARLHAGSSVVRLGIVVSVAAALAAIVLDLVLDVPAVLILVPVVVVGFALSWHASGPPDGAPPG